MCWRDILYIFTSGIAIAHLQPEFSLFYKLSNIKSVFADDESLIVCLEDSLMNNN